MSDKKSTNVKSRNWAFFVYPDSAPTDWMNQLQQTGLPCAISPLHAADIRADESEKKPHWHVIACWSGPTTFNVVKNITDSFNSPIPQALQSIKGYYRYLTHKDDPDKAQYDEKDIKLLNGFNILDFAELTRKEVMEIILRIQKYIRENDILEYADLLDNLADFEMLTEFDVARSHTMLLNNYITSRRNKGRSSRMELLERIVAHISKDELDKAINATELQDEIRQYADL